MTTTTNKKKKAVMKTAVSRQEKHSTPVSSEQVSLKAYELWMRRGCVHGFDLEDWLKAEQILLEEQLQ